MDIFEYNSKAWDCEVRRGSPWSKPVSSEEIQQARMGKPRIFLTPTKPVLESWLGSLKGAKVLCLASGGGQQGPLLAAAGANVTVIDASEEQLKKDEFVSARDHLKMELVKGDMRNLSAFGNSEFDLIIHPVSNCFVPDIKPVWRECYRVLKSGGSLLSGFNNPIIYAWDRELYKAGVLQIKYSIPYSDLKDLTEKERQAFIDQNEPLEFGHSLEDQVGGQIIEGFIINGFFEDQWGNGRLEDKYLSHFLATRALKP